MRRRLAGWLLVALGAVGLLALVAAWSAGGASAVGSPLFLALFPGLALALGIGLLRREAGGAAAPERAAPTVDVRVVPKGPVSACLRCGSSRMQPAPLGADALFSQWRCANCGWRGQPLQFDNGEAYAAFVRGLREDREAPR